LQTLCGEVSSPQFVHLLNAGASNFQTFERLVSRLALDVFLFGTAMIKPPVKHNFTKMKSNHTAIHSNYSHTSCKVLYSYHRKATYSAAAKVNPKLQFLSNQCSRYPQQYIHHCLL
jgi:hypothetical protein